jgi:hypothetical protein
MRLMMMTMMMISLFDDDEAVGVLSGVQDVRKIHSK